MSLFEHFNIDRAMTGDVLPSNKMKNFYPLKKEGIICRSYGCPPRCSFEHMVEFVISKMFQLGISVITLVPFNYGSRNKVEKRLRRVKMSYRCETIGAF
eukprot:scaffold735_cov116-Cylindrotheca_fusiformis.AAC.8